MSILCCLIRKCMFYDFEESHYSVRPTKNISCMEDEITVDNSRITRGFNKLCSGYKDIDDQASLGRPKTDDFTVMIQVLDGNQGSTNY